MCWLLWVVGELGQFNSFLGVLTRVMMRESATR